MRVKRTSHGLTVQAIAGTYVVLLGFDLPKKKCTGLLGFAVHRTDHTEDEAYWLSGLKTFEATDPGLPPGSSYSTREHPVQGFTWSDFTAKPDHRYTYKVVALKGTPENLTEFAAVTVAVRTESPEGGNQDVFFNRGAAASQAYVRRFGDRSPKQAGQAAFDWLSRGLYESMTTFIERATGPGWKLRVAAYEFHYAGVLEALSAARKRKADVKIVYDRRKANPGKKNDAAVAKAGLKTVSTKRTATKSAISHNKFIVLLKGDTPQAVYTGGTNFSEGGIFGHSNAAHVVDSPAVARKYFEYWTLLQADEQNADLKPQVMALFTQPADDPPTGVRPVFSPRGDLGVLDWYARLAGKAKHGLFATFAFGVNPRFQDVYRTSTATIRYALLEKATRSMKRGPQRTAEEHKIRSLRAMPANRFAIGAHLRLNKFDRWLGEKTSGLNRNVQYVHTKYMLIDPLSDDPIVVAGSANFSDASTNKNDENMLVIRGNKRVADIYLGEFMRLYNHYAFREWAARPQTPDNLTFKFLRTDDWWREYFGDTERSRQRAFFVNAD